MKFCYRTVAPVPEKQSWRIWVNKSFIHEEKIIQPQQNITELCADFMGYSVLPIYRGRVYRGIGYIAVARWTPFFGAQECDIFREIAVTPWTQFAGDDFSWNLLTAIAFVLGPQETIFRKTNSSLPVNAGWNTWCAVVSHARRSIDTSIVSQSRVQLIQCQCKSHF